VYEGWKKHGLNGNKVTIMTLKTDTAVICFQSLAWSSNDRMWFMDPIIYNQEIFIVIFIPSLALQLRSLIFH
jgi:hypothetical protein